MPVRKPAARWKAHPTSALRLRLRAGLRQQGRGSFLAFPGVCTPGYASFGPAGLAGTSTRLLKSGWQSFVAGGLGTAHRQARGGAGEAQPHAPRNVNSIGAIDQLLGGVHQAPVFGLGADDDEKGLSASRQLTAESGQPNGTTPRLRAGPRQQGTAKWTRIHGNPVEALRQALRRGTTPPAPRRPAAARKGIFPLLPTGLHPWRPIFRPCGPRVRTGCASVFGPPATRRGRVDSVGWEVTGWKTGGGLKTGMPARKPAARLKARPTRRIRIPVHLR